MESRAPWFLVGPLLGLVIVGLLWTTNRPLGGLGGYIDLYDWLKKPSRAAGWRLFFLVGVIAGGLAFSLLASGVHPTLAYGWLDGAVGSPAAKAALVGSAGLLMGYGARTAGGCTSGHGLCGTALASPASYVATMTFMTTAVLGAHAVAWVLR